MQARVAPQPAATKTPEQWEEWWSSVGKWVAAALGALMFANTFGWLGQAPANWEEEAFAKFVGKPCISVTSGTQYCGHPAARVCFTSDPRFLGDDAGEPCERVYEWAKKNTP